MLLKIEAVDTRRGQLLPIGKTALVRVVNKVDLVRICIDANSKIEMRILK